MQAIDVKIRAEYALREPPRSGVDLQHVRVLEKVRAGRWTVEWIDPNPGLVDYVKSANLIVPWREHKALARDEQHHAALAQYSGSKRDGSEGPVSEAVDLVSEATGESLSNWPAGVLTYQPNELAGVAERANIEPPSHHLGYRDRHGNQHLPFECALELARRFAASEPNTVISHIEVQERKYETELHEPGNSYLLSLVNRWRASWALARQWAGLDAAIAAREAKNKKLRELLHRTIWELRRSDVDVEPVARRLERALHGQ